MDSCNFPVLSLVIGYLDWVANWTARYVDEKQFSVYLEVEDGRVDCLG